MWSKKVHEIKTKVGRYIHTHPGRQAGRHTHKQTDIRMTILRKTRHDGAQQLQCAADDCGGVSSERRIWSGNSLYSSASVSSASACRATAWNACSTFSASLALVSKYGRLPLLVHHCCARFGITFDRTRHRTRHVTVTNLIKCLRFIHFILLVPLVPARQTRRPVLLVPDDQHTG